MAGREQQGKGRRKIQDRVRGLMKMCSQWGLTVVGSVLSKMQLGHPLLPDSEIFDETPSDTGY